MRNKKGREPIFMRCPRQFYLHKYRQIYRVYVFLLFKDQLFVFLESKSVICLKQVLS